MRTAIRVLLSSAWLLALGGGWFAHALAQSLPAAKSPVRPAARLAVTQEEPMIPPARRPVRPAASRQEAHRPGSEKPLPVVAERAGSAERDPLPLPPRPPAVPPPPVPPPPPPAKAAETLPDPEKPEGTAAKLPRFASLRSDDVNMRVGPGQRYRIEWVYKRRELPVEITREFDVWRYVRDADGIQGWMQQATLMGRRTFVVQSADATLREQAKESAPAVAVLKAGVIGRIRSCEASSDWCMVQAGSYRGYLRREQFWGTLPHEAINP